MFISMIYQEFFIYNGGIEIEHCRFIVILQRSNHDSMK